MTYKIIVSGLVQGVGFRQFIAGKARERGLKGWARNLETGEVEIVVDGPTDTIDGFISEDVRSGPPSAHISDVRIESIEAPANLSTFTITY